jgi:DNA-directed RNA polymerase subunit E'/Rpb7
MEHQALFEERIPLTPKDLNRLAEEPVEDVLLQKIRAKLEGRCSRHGFVVPNTMTIVSRSMGHIEVGRFTGDIVYQVQSQGLVLNPADGTTLVGEVLKKNKMGVYVEYRDAIRVLLPRDLHHNDETFESLVIGTNIEFEIKKSRFQVNDQYIQCVGVFKSVIAAAVAAGVGAAGVGSVGSAGAGITGSVNESDEEEEEANANANANADISAPSPSPGSVEAESEEEE